MLFCNADADARSIYLLFWAKPREFETTQFIAVTNQLIFAPVPRQNRRATLKNVPKWVPSVPKLAGKHGPGCFHRDHAGADRERTRPARRQLRPTIVLHRLVIRFVNLIYGATPTTTRQRRVLPGPNGVVSHRRPLKMEWGRHLACRLRLNGPGNHRFQMRSAQAGSPRHNFLLTG